MLKHEASTSSFDPGPLLHALMALHKGNFDTRLPENSTDIGREIAKAFNEVAALNKDLADELERVGSGATKDRNSPRTTTCLPARGPRPKPFPPSTTTPTAPP